MDLRRPTRNPNPPARRHHHLFHAPSRRPLTHPLSTAISTSALHIPAEEAERNDDLVERDGSGNYNMAAPSTNLKPNLGVAAELDEETEQENQMISLYGKRNEHWDTATIMSEIKAALESSLEKKVQSLEHDRWMFEGEGKSKG
ncbi:uncharacterized protein BDR25DRAFT_281139 [Lindgomyces ingoldianus]|uniref:Uncharacterized protein n=1 Tax=Lindgomyces ingoldianus TaxID=673940 RepID=A0ACB6R4T8_9PLEO|nr:uncharacterized protein BDR25DRAFT_281139 [Lindgomyces ingoldianus]KAF2474283.1 hypothetical protein BDR25DRAFT_281139 [Lindgomyces ingoldianus]